MRGGGGGGEGGREKRVRPHKGSGALLIRELIGMPRMPTTMEHTGGWVTPSGRGWGAPGGFLQVPV